MKLNNAAWRLAYPGYGLALALILVLLIGFELWYSYWSTRQDAARNLQNLVFVLSEQTDRTMQSVDNALRGICDQLQEDPNLPVNDPEFRSEMRKRLGKMPFVRAFFVIGADGYITHDTDYPTTPHVSLADRPYFQIHRDDSSDETIIGHPLMSRSVNAWFVSMTRRINNPDGSFAGVAVAAVEPLYFQRFYQQLWVGNGAISLFLKDGTLLARSPENNPATGQSFSTQEPFNSLLAEGRSGVFWGTSAIDGVARAVGFTQLGDYPLVMVAAQDEDVIMRPWRSHATTQSIGGILLMAALLFLEWTSRQFRARETKARLALDQARRLETLGRFASGIAHDFGNQSQIIRSGALLLKPHVGDRPDAARLVDEIVLSADTLRHLINHLLSYSRGERPRPKPCDLRSAILEMLPILQQAAGQRVNIVTDLADDELLCVIDRTQFQTSILNLVLNARDASLSEEQVKIRLDSTVRPEDGSTWAQVTVEDHGVGMSPIVLSRAMDPFFTTKEPSDGSGIGLYQVSQFAEISGGHFDISSSEEAGTRARILLPVLRGQPMTRS